VGRVEAFTPESLDEVAALLLAADETARPVFQGVGLVARLGPPEGGSLVLDLSRVPELNRLEFDERDGIRIGSAVRLERFLAFPPISLRYRVFLDGLEECVARGDGSVTLAEALSRPAAVPGVILPLLSCRADVAVYGPYGWSELAVEALCQPGRPALQFGEFAVHLSLPAPPVRSGCAYASHAPEGGEPLAVAAVLAMEEDLATCCGARVLYFAAEGRPERAVESERFLAGRRLDDVALERAAALAGEAVQAARMGGSSEPGATGRLASQVLHEARGRVTA
jgi:carbon-monoxide dehydrogenase medium subunit/2-furoyl-CoA dehydrogenase FAD binding subunit